MDDLGAFDSSLLVKVGVLAAVGFGVWYLFLRKKAPALPAQQFVVPTGGIVSPSISQGGLPGPLQPLMATGSRMTQDYVNMILQQPAPPTSNVTAAAAAVVAAKAKAAGF